MLEDLKECVLLIHYEEDGDTFSKIFLGRINRRSDVIEYRGYWDNDERKLFHNCNGSFPLNKVRIEESEAPQEKPEEDELDDEE